jgi:hypothetical protein
VSTSKEIQDVFNEDIERKSKMVREKLLSRLLRKKGNIDIEDLGSVPDEKDAMDAEEQNVL